MSEEDDFSHAADEPTAMWNEESLQALALDAPTEQQESAAATKGVGSASPSVEIALGPPSGQRPTHQAGQRRASKITGLSWGITIVLALGLGAGVYFLVRFLK